MASRVERARVAGIEPVSGVEPVALPPPLGHEGHDQQGSPLLWLLHLAAPAVASVIQPGQFLLLRCADPDHPTFDPFLPRAYFVFATDRQAGRLSLLVEVRGRGSAWLTSRREGDTILVHGPVGREVRPERLTRHLLLLAEGAVAVASVSLLAADAARLGRSVTLIANTPAGAADVPPQLLPADVEYRTTTPEAGGLLGALPGALSWADELVVAAPLALLEALALLRRARLEPFTLHANLPVQAVPLPAFSSRRLDRLDTAGAALRGGGDAVPCGTGSCGACVVRTGRGARLFCRQGPAFPLAALRFDTHEANADEGEVAEPADDR